MGPSLVTVANTNTALNPGFANAPNIVLILVDDLRYDALEITGHPFFSSPSIDSIGKEGVVFSSAFVTTSLCSPSRASVLTGRYASRHGIRYNSTSMPANTTTLATVLQEAGYRTAFVGKWHMGTGITGANPQPGFDRWVSFPGQGTYTETVLNVDGVVDTLRSGHLTDYLTDEALDFIEWQDDRPYFLILSHKAVHAPYIAQDRFRGLHSGAEIITPLTYGQSLDSLPEFIKCRLITGIGWQRQYFDVLAGVEESTSRIMQTIRELGQDDNTLVIFTSDNGFLFGEHNLGDKRVAYEESIRIPLLVRYPALFPQGHVIDDLVLNIDLTPTILQAAGVHDHEMFIQGISLVDIVDGIRNRDSFFYEYFQEDGGVRIKCTPSIDAVRTRDFKLITYPNTSERDELYDLRTDPIEAYNEIDNPDFDGVETRLRFALDSLRNVVRQTPSPIVPIVDPILPSVSQNYPNPIHTAATISYDLPRHSDATVTVHDILGRQIKVLVSTTQPAGHHDLSLDAAGLPSGIYFYRLQAGDYVETKRMVVVK